MTKKVAVIQSCYIPWKGYFDIINMVDEFVLYDEVQFTKNDWRNRNKLKTRNGLQWLSIPVFIERLSQKISDTKVADRSWNKRHWKTIMHNYSRAKHFPEYKDLFEDMYLALDETYLSRINHRFLMLLNEFLCIKTKVSLSSDYSLIEGKLDRLVYLCKQAGATEYISGPAAKGYIDEGAFAKEGIKVTWMDYSGYPEYHQLWPPFEHGVSIIDLIFNEGPDASKYMKSFSCK